MPPWPPGAWLPLEGLQAATSSDSEAMTTEWMRM
jgi:hypothetical protein